MRIAVIGSNGQLGTDVCRAFRTAGEDVFPLTHSDIEIGSQLSVHAALQPITPNLIVNTAAAHNVDNCEADPAGAFAVNAIGVRNLALFARDTGACLAHISTDYVFNGRKTTPYSEFDLALPLNVYGTSKLAGEQFVQALAPRHFILRVSGLYGLSPCRAKGGLNFIERMLKLAAEGAQIRVVADEYTAPTHTEEIARQLVSLAATRDYGLYHATAEGSCSWYEFASAIFELARVDVSLERCASGDFPVKAVRPKYSVLENFALKRLGLNTFTHWRNGLETYLSQRYSQSTAALAG